AAPLLEAHSPAGRGAGRGGFRTPLCAFPGPWPHSFRLACNIRAEVPFQRSGFCHPGACNTAQSCGWTGGARRFAGCGPVQEKLCSMVRGSVRLANGGISFVRAGCVSVVSALDAAVHALDLDVTDPRLDSEHHSYLLCLELAQARPAVG